MGQSLKAKWNKILKDEGLGVFYPGQDRRLSKFYNKDKTKHTVESVYEPEDECGDMWEALTLAHRATAKEAEIANRRRGTICGLDSRQRPVSLKPQRVPREKGKDWRKRIQDTIINTYS